MLVLEWTSACTYICVYVCASVCLRMHACACPRLCRLTLFTAVVTALWSVPPAGGPWCAGWVCGGGVIVVSPGSWVLRFEKRESERGIHPSIRASIHIPRPNRKPGAERAGRGRRRGGEDREGESQKEREPIWVCWKRESDICKSLQALWGSLASFVSCLFPR